MPNTLTKHTLISIDAWRDSDGGWQWNNLHKLQEGLFFDHYALSNRALLKWARGTLGLLSEQSKGKMAIERDDLDVVIVLKSTREPLFAFRAEEE